MSHGALSVVTALRSRELFLSEKFGGDAVGDFVAAWRAYLEGSTGSPAGRDGSLCV
jgi:hypothetical protein